ncbi:MAG: PAS domain-containing protein [Phycisphaerae bacterium]
MVEEPSGAKPGSADILRLSEEANRLRSELARLRRILATSNEGFWLIDNDVVTLEVNDAMCRILGRPRTEIIGRPIFDFADAREKYHHRARPHGLGVPADR